MDLDADDPLALAVVDAIRRGDTAGLRAMLDQHAGLATAWIGPRSLLHVVADWPGNVPDGAAAVRVLVAAGADVDARFGGPPHSETPLHWAASCDDVAVLDALLDAGSDIEATGAVIAGGTPMADATAFGQWAAARRLVERGARTTLWEAAALGLHDRVRAAIETDQRPSQDEVTSAFWGACHGGQREVAAYLLDHGADLDWIGWDGLTPLDAAVRSDAAALVEWLRARGARSAADVR